MRALAHFASLDPLQCDTAVTLFHEIKVDKRRTHTTLKRKGHSHIVLFPTIFSFIFYFYFFTLDTCFSLRALKFGLKSKFSHIRSRTWEYLEVELADFKLS